MTRSDRPTRREFLKTSGMGTAALLAGLSGAARVPAAAAAPSAGAAPWGSAQLALASYTCRKFSLDQTLDMANQAGLKAICLKSFHLPLDANAEQIAEAVAKVKKAGLRLYGGGVIGMKNEDQVQRAFEYAKAAGMIRIIASPSPEMLPLISQTIPKYDIQVCIHNHGPGDRHFPTPEVAYEKIQGLDKRLGLCHDVGHTVRYGQDPVAATLKCADRLYDVHLKDVTEAAKSGHGTVCGRGVVDLAGVLGAMKKVGYQGYLAFEYEAEADNPLPGLSESVRYVRKLLQTI